MPTVEPTPTIRARRGRKPPAVGRGPAVILAAGLAFACAVLLGCGGSPQQPSGPTLVVDLKIGDPAEQRSILGATLLLDGKEVARFRQGRPEMSVLFSRHISGVSPGEHELAVRIYEQVESPTGYSAVGTVIYDSRTYPLIGTGGALATGQAFHWRLTL